MNHSSTLQRSFSYPRQISSTLRREKACDFSKWLQFYAFDVIGEMTYSKRHGFIEEDIDIDVIVDYLGKLFSYVAPVSPDFREPQRIGPTITFNIGQIPILDLLFLKNPLYHRASEYKLVDSTFPVARFAQKRMAERYPGGKIDPEAAQPIAGSQPDLLSKFIQDKIDRSDFMTDTHVLTLCRKYGVCRLRNHSYILVCRILLSSQESCLHE